MDEGHLGRAWLKPTVVGAAVLAVVSGYGQFGVTTVLGDVAETFGASDAGSAVEVGLSATTLGIGLAVIRLAGLGSLPVAALADHRGRRIALWTAAAGLVLTVVAAGMPSFWVFVTVAALARPLLAGTNAIATVITAEATRTADRSRALAVVEFGYAIGAGLVVVVHGLGSTVLGFRGVLGLGALLLLVFPWLSARVRESELYERSAGVAHGEPAAPRPVGPGRLGRVGERSRQRLVVVCALAASLGLVTGPAFTFVFVYGENALGLSPGYMTVVVVVGGVLGLPGLLLGRWAADRFGRRITAATATALLAVSAWVTYADGSPSLAVGYVSAVALSAVFGPAGGALFTEVFPTRDRSTATGWASAAGVVGSVVGLALFGSLVDVLGSFARAGATMWLPLIPLVGLYALLPETRHDELEDLDREP